MSDDTTKQPIPPQREFLSAVRRAPFGELTIYEVAEPELELLERGSPDSLFLNFAISLLSVAISLSVTFATTSIPSDRVFIVLVLLTIVGYVAGLLLLILWWRTHRSVLSVAAAIRRRLPPEGQEELTSRVAKPN
jgi:hypothetical protein